MFKKMKLGTKIIAGFSVIIAISVVLGIVATVSMQNVRSSMVVLSERNLPQMMDANGIERAIRGAMFDMRAFAFTDDEAILAEAQKKFDESLVIIERSKQVATSYQDTQTETTLGAAKTGVDEYKSLADQSAVITRDIIAQRTALGAAAENLLKINTEYRSIQEKELADKLATVTGAAGQGAVTLEELSNHLKCIAASNEITAAVITIRMGVWRGIGLRDATAVLESVKQFEGVVAQLDEMQALSKEQLELDGIAAIRASVKEYQDGTARFAQLWGDRDKLVAKRTAVGNGVLGSAQSIADNGSTVTKTSAAQTEASLIRASAVLLIGQFVAAALGIALAILITMSITRPIRRIIASLTSGADQTSAAASQVSQSSQSMAQGATEQASSLEETSASLEEMTSMTKQNADNAAQAKSLAGESDTSARKGVQAMERMSKAIDDIKRSSDETAKIIKTIDEIAFQTNLLALNAAVEAARAGDAGKGFAVVAEEVRNLAQRSAEAARKTAAMIEESVKNASNGVQISQEVGEALHEIGATALRVNSLVSEIAMASNEQAQGIGQVSQAVAQMDTVTQQSAANTEESAAAAEELSAQAEEMSRMVGELTDMVGGVKTQSNRPVAAFTAPPRKSANAGGSARQKALTHSAAATASAERRVAHPSHVIPLDDDDLKDF